MMNKHELYVCLSGCGQLEDHGGKLECPICKRVYPIKNGVPSFAKRDAYWGEFAESDMDEVLGFMRDGKYDEAKIYIDKLGRTDFIFGVARSDFLYGLPLTKSSVVLDVGCGLGIHSFNAARFAGAVYGFDQSLKRAEFCDLRRKLDGNDKVRFFHGDIIRMPFAAGTFDAILMNGVVEWLGEMKMNFDPREDQIQCLKALRKLLKPGGILYIGIENRYALTYLHNAKDHNRLKYTTFMPRFLANYVTKAKKGRPYRTYTYSKFGYDRLLKDAGFDTANNTQYYIAHPGYNLPQYLIPFDDLSAFRFFMEQAMSGRGRMGRVARLFMKVPGFGRLIRHGFYSYAIYTKK